MIVLESIYFALSCIILIISGVSLVKSLVHIARVLNMSEFSAGFIVMAIITSLPEFFISINAVFSGNSLLGLGNILGSNILDVTLVSGIIILSAKHITLNMKKTEGDIKFMIISVFLFIALSLIGNELSRIDGIILLLFFGLHMHTILKKQTEKKIATKVQKQIKRDNIYAFTIFIIALISLFISSRFVAFFASQLALGLNVAPITIGLFLISFTTVLPEMVFGIAASTMKHKALAIGDQIGGIVVHSTLIIGILALIRPMKIDASSFIVPAMFMLIAVFIFAAVMKTRGKLEKNEGIALILLYVFFMMIQFLWR